MLLSLASTLAFLFIAEALCLPATREDGYLKLDVEYYLMSLLVVQLELGTPAQNKRFVLDTGSADLWILTPNNTQSRSCDYCDSYDISTSSSWENLNITYDMQYLSGNITGIMGTDMITFNGKVLNGSQFAVISQGDVEVGALFGIGPISNENIYVEEYDNIPKKLATSGVINRNLISLYAGTKDTTTGGSLLFSAIDHAKFKGTLTEIDCVPQYVGAPLKSYWVNFNSFTLGTKNSTTELLTSPITALFDSGTSVNALPDFLYNYILYDYFGVSHPDALVPCDNNDTLTYKLDSFEITLPISDNLFEVENGRCAIAFLSSGSDTNFIFGIPALQKIYTVFDTDNFKVYVAPAVQTEEQNIEVVYKDTNLKTISGK